MKGYEIAHERRKKSIWKEKPKKSHFSLFGAKKGLFFGFSFQIDFLRLSCAISYPFINNTDRCQNDIFNTIT